MKWFKFEHQEEENTEEEILPILVYLSPEALKHSYVVDDFNSFQDTPECVPGGKFLEISRQYSFKLRQVADLVEEPLEDDSLNMQSISKRNFHEEIKPEKKLLNSKEDHFELSDEKSNIENPPILGIEGTLENSLDSHDKLNTEQVPFKDLESLFVK
tara:strand:+ start:1340 stop:1810 length:471 start_codon:yes stop_codon:yes gene_type:complete